MGRDRWEGKLTTTAGKKRGLRKVSWRLICFLQPGNNDWPAIAPSTVTQSNTKQGRIDTLESQLLKAQFELQREQSNAKKNVSEREELEAKLEKIETNLNNARKKLLNLQSPQYISDDQVKQAFDDLCQNIEDWVDGECQGLTSLEEIFSTHSWTPLEMCTAEHHITEDDIKLSEELPNTRFHVIMNAIFSFVYDRYLREERWGPSANANEELLLDGLVEAMSMQKSTRNGLVAPELQSGLRFTNNPQLRRWRSETIQALQYGTYRTHIREGNLGRARRELYYMLKHFADKGANLQSDKLRSKIIEPAYTLADMIKASTSGYKFNFMVSSSSPDTCLKAQDVTQYRIVDAHTGTEEAIVEDPEGSLGRLRLCVFPALQKVQDSGERPCMSKALIVLDRSAEMGRKQIAAVSDIANGASEVADVTDRAVIPEVDGTTSESKKHENQTHGTLNVTEKEAAQISFTTEKLPVKHEHVWVDGPQQKQAEITW